jgi:hypothetical protein
MTLQPQTAHPHGPSDEAFDALFTRAKPIVLEVHGYLLLIHRLTYRRTNHAKLHVHGFKTISVSSDRTCRRFGTGYGTRADNELRTLPMCFSATASFVAGTTLSGIGVVTITKADRRSELPFASIPLLFGIQQLVEGVLWLTFSHDAPVLKQTMTYVFSVFSYVLWPIYIPFAFRVLETTPWRRTAMLWFQAVGLAVGLYLFYISVSGSVVAEVVGHHIVYNSPHFSLVSVTALYVVATCFTGFFSSHTFVRLWGLLALLSFIATYFFYTRAFVSVWCFFAAILSLLIYLHLRYRRLGGFPAIDSLYKEREIAKSPSQIGSGA